MILPANRHGETVVSPKCRIRMNSFPPGVNAKTRGVQSLPECKLQLILKTVKGLFFHFCLFICLLVFNLVPCFTLGWFLSLTLRHMHEKNGPANFAEDRTNGEGFNPRHTNFSNTSPHLDLFFCSVAISIFFILLIFFKSQKSSMYWKYSILPYFKDCAPVLPHLRQALRRVWCNLRANILCKHPAPCTVVLSYSQIPMWGHSNEWSQQRRCAWTRYPTFHWLQEAVTLTWPFSQELVDDWWRSSHNLSFIQIFK